jgi:hypothetical protein
MAPTYKVTGTITLDITVEQVGGGSQPPGGGETPPPGGGQPPVQPPSWTPMIDERLASIRAGIQERAGTRYKVRYAWLVPNGDRNQAPEWARPLMTAAGAGGDHHCFGQVWDRDGMVVMDARFILAWPGGSDARTPERDGWANIPIYAGFDPTKTQGPYTWSAVDGDTLVGVGLPLNHHVSFWVIWQER